MTEISRSGRPVSPRRSLLLLATVFGGCVRVEQYWGTNFLLLARNGKSLPDVARLVPERARSRFRHWSGYETWSRTPELDDLFATGEIFRTATRVIEPRNEEWVLSDDHAPLEWLTDRFRDELEKQTLKNDEQRRDDLKNPLARQRNLPLVIDLVWLVTLGAGWFVLRRIGE